MVDKLVISVTKENMAIYEKELKKPFFDKGDIKEISLYFICIFFIVFGFLTIRTMFFEESQNNPGYVTYQKCIDSDTEYDIKGSTTSECNEYKTFTKPLKTRLLEHLRLSFFIPLLLLIATIIFKWNQRKQFKKKVDELKSEIIDLYGEK